MADVATAPAASLPSEKKQPEQQPDVEMEAMEVDPVPKTPEENSATDASASVVPSAEVPPKTEEPTELERIMAKIKPSSFGEKRKYSRIDISPENWLLTMDDESRAKLANPPSIPKIDAETEQDLRFLGCELIQYGAQLLKLPQTAAATAQITYQRFYYQKSFAKHHFEYSVMACLLLASKIEECVRRPREVMNVFHYLEHFYRRRHTAQPYKEYVPMALDAKYVQTKNQVIKMERRILCALGFVVHVKHPHKLIVCYARILKCEENEKLMQKAWSYMNDGLRTDMFLRYRAETIACACIHLAARTVEPKVPLPQQPFMWFELYDVSERDVEDISLMLLKMYTRTQTPNWNRLLDVIDKARFGDEPPPEAKPKTEEPVLKTKAMLAAEEVIKKAREEAIREGRLRADGSDVSTPGTGENKRKNERVTTMSGRDRDRERDRDRGRRRRHRSSSSSRSRSGDRKRSHKRSKRDRGDRDRDRDRRNGRDYDRDKDRDKNRDRRDRHDRDRDSRKSEKEKSRAREKEVVQTLHASKRRSPSPSDRSKRK